MPTQSRELWIDWCATADREPHVTIDELITHIATTHPDVTPTQIRYWQRIGVLPMPLRRRHGNATMALYPLDTATATINRLFALQDLGCPLRQIGPRLRAFAGIGSDQEHEDVKTLLAMLARLMEIGGTDVITGAEVRFFTATGQERAIFFDVAPAAHDVP